MADDVAALLGSSAPATTAKTPDLADKKPSMPDLAAASKTEADQLNAIEKRVNEADSKIESRIEGLRPPKLELAPPPAVKQTDPRQAWASAAMLAAALGSMMTRRPLMTAMNAAAGVLDAYHKGDQEAANAAYAQWKVANENAMKLQQFELDSYRDILSQADRSERLIESEASRQEREVVAQWNAQASAFRDDIALQTANERGVEGMERLIIERQRLQDQQDANASKLAAQKAFMDDWNGWQKQHPKATAEERFDALTDIMSKSQVGLHPMTESQRAHMEQTMAQQTGNSQLGKAYQSAEQQLQTVENLARPGVIAQSALADAYTQLINGGRAIRGFQMKMNTEHGSLWDKANIAEHQITTGGPLSDQMVKDMREISRQIVAERREQFGHVIDAAKKRAEGMSLNPDLVVPDFYNPTPEAPKVKAVDRAHIPSDAIAQLKTSLKDAKTDEAKATVRKQFDEIFPSADGSSWAEKLAPK